MNGLLTALCGQYYKMKLKLNKQDDRFKELFDNVLKFDQHAKISELDDILHSRNKAYNAYEKVQITYEKVKETEQHIVQLLKMLGIRPNWFLTGEIEGELEYEVWYDRSDNVYIIKTEDLAPLVDDENIITIKIRNSEDDVDDEDDD